MSNINFKQSLLLWRIPGNIPGNMLVVHGFVYSRDNKDEVKNLLEPWTRLQIQGGIVIRCLILKNKVWSFPIWTRS